MMKRNHAMSEGQLRKMIRTNREAFYGWMRCFQYVRSYGSWNHHMLIRTLAAARKEGIASDPEFLKRCNEYAKRNIRFSSCKSHDKEIENLHPYLSASLKRKLLTELLSTRFTSWASSSALYAGYYLATSQNDYKAVLSKFARAPWYDLKPVLNEIGFWRRDPEVKRILGQNTCYKAQTLRVSTDRDAVEALRLAVRNIRRFGKSYVKSNLIVKPEHLQALTPAARYSLIEYVSHFYCRTESAQDQRNAIGNRHKYYGLNHIRFDLTPDQLKQTLFSMALVDHGRLVNVLDKYKSHKRSGASELRNSKRQAL